MNEGKLQQRLRQVLELLANAPRSCTEDGDDQGSWPTSVDFVEADLIESAGTLLAEWDAEDARATQDPDTTAHVAEREVDRG